MSAAVKESGVGEDQLRHRSMASVEYGYSDSRGRRATIQAEDLGLADRELAEKYGYKPVRMPQRTYRYLLAGSAQSNCTKSEP